MRVLDLSFASPEANLACDEALLEAIEDGEGSEVLRFWESPQVFVALGYTNRASTEANVEACRAAQVPILRRTSGGGTVLQGPGCLSYALVLRLPERGPLSGVQTANAWIMARQRDALQSLLEIPVVVRGHTDLALSLPVGERKFSGNAQRRRKRALLFHGTLLLDFDLPLITRLLRSPSTQPEYRAARPHGEFVCNLPLSREAVKAALCQAWDVSEPLLDVPHARIERLVAERYESREWNEKF